MIKRLVPDTVEEPLTSDVPPCVARAEDADGPDGGNKGRPAKGKASEDVPEDVSAEDAPDGDPEVPPAGLEDELAELPPLPAFPKHPTEEDKARLVRTLEAILFASTEGLAPSRLAEVVGVPVGLVKESLEELAKELDRDQRPYELRPHGGTYRLYTRADYYPFLLRLKTLKKVERLTPAALETLAVVAYRQPVIRAEIEAIRGVRVGPLLRALLDRKLIKVVGRAPVPGAPLQYGTTRRFLDRFGLASLKDLPSLKEFKQGRI